MRFQFAEAGTAVFVLWPDGSASLPSPFHGSAVSRRHHPSALVVWCACILSFEVALAVCHQAWLKVQLLDPHGSGGPRLEWCVSHQVH